MATQTSVVTPERYETGFSSFAEWQEKIENRQEEFQKHYDEYQPNADDIAAIKKLVQERGIKAMVIGENWCPDVWRGLPVVSKMQEATDMTVRYFFRDQHKDFRRAGAEVLGVSRDSLASHQKFKDKMKFPFELLSDEDEAVCKQFGVMKMKNMYGRKVRGIERSTFVIDGKGVLVREWRGVRVPGHVQEVLNFVKAL